VQLGEIASDKDKVRLRLCVCANEREEGGGEERTKWLMWVDVKDFEVKLGGRTLNL